MCGRAAYKLINLRGPLTVDNPVWEICERVAEVQALLDDHLAGGKHSAADVVAKAQGGEYENLTLACKKCGSAKELRIKRI